MGDKSEVLEAVLKEAVDLVITNDRSTQEFFGILCGDLVLWV